MGAKVPKSLKNPADKLGLKNPHIQSLMHFWHITLLLIQRSKVDITAKVVEEEARV